MSLETLLAQLDVDMDVFIDFCIMCGCDYCGTIRGIGPSTAFKLLKTHGSIEKVVATLDQAKIPPPDEWRIQEARQLFKSPEVRLGLSSELQSSLWRDAVGVHR